MEGLLTASAVRMADPQAVTRKVNALLNGGFDQLQVISDFDYTISKFVDENGDRCWTTHGIFDAESARVDEKLGEQLNILKEKYMAIEFDPHLPIEEKVPHMEIWWKTAHDLISKSGFSRSTLEEFVRDAKIYFRDDCRALLSLLETASVPLILFSAGIGDMIEIFLRQQLGSVPTNLHLISNMMQFDAQDRVVGFSEPLIHTFCKNGSVISRERSFFHDIRNRHNVLLLGDSLGDLHMDVGVENEGVVFKIGFLNFNQKELLAKYLAGYDVVLVDDQSMRVPVQLLRAIAASANLAHLPPTSTTTDVSTSPTLNNVSTPNL